MPKIPPFHYFKDMRIPLIIAHYFVVFRTLMRSQSLIEGGSGEDECLLFRGRSGGGGEGSGGQDPPFGEPQTP